MIEPKITPELVKEHGINEEEWQFVLKTLKREPNFTELGIISVMWSEHASYKNSIELIKTLPREGKALLTETGEENAGVIDIGEGLAVSFKIESHNHPSAVEPYHGAATGVGGILRDIFTMGARPIAVLNSLRFGNPDDSNVKFLMHGVVDGIADYGNCFGVPNIGGEVYFEDSYTGNPLVNAMAVGILKHEHLAKSGAEGIGNMVMYVGAKTGRDGIHGTTFASVEITEESEENRTAVQVGDPFLEKLLMEATLETIEADIIVAVQDMGAAGLTCSTSEMSGKTGVGIEIDVNLVPKRETGMTPYEIMLSESQERMLMIVEPHHVAQVKEIYKKWDLDAEIIGKVTDDGLLRVKEGDVVKAELPSKMLILGGDAPVYNREAKKPDYIDEVQNADLAQLPEPKDYNATMLKVISSSNIASKRSIYNQYDHMIQANTMVEPGSDAGVIRIQGTNKALAMSTDCNGRHCWLNPYEGAKGAVAESARNVVCSGATPMAISNCLNFGNPYKPDVFWTFKEAIRGITDACLAFDTPVTGGNVSFYNESPQGSIYPTPTIAMLGIIEDKTKIMDQYFKDDGDVIILLGDRANNIGGSEYLKEVHNKITGNAPIVDVEKEKRLYEVVLKLIDERLIKSAHDCSDGGLAIAIAESCFNPQLKTKGAIIDLDFEHRIDAELFGEAHSRVVISTVAANVPAILEICGDFPCTVIGEVTGDRFMINKLIDLPKDELHSAWYNKIK